eukprot:tig00000137_g8148.t1
MAPVSPKAVVAAAAAARTSTSSPPASPKPARQSSSKSNERLKEKQAAQAPPPPAPAEAGPSKGTKGRGRPKNSSQPKRASPRTQKKATAPTAPAHDEDQPDERQPLLQEALPVPKPLPTKAPPAPRNTKRGKMLTDRSKRTLVLSKLKADAAVLYDKELYNKLMKFGDGVDFTKFPDLVEADGTLRQDYLEIIANKALEAIGWLERASPVMTEVYLIGRHKKVALLHLTDIEVSMEMNRELRTRFPDARGCLAEIELALGHAHRTLKIRFCQDLSVASRHAVYAGLTDEQRELGWSYRIFCGIPGVYTDEAFDEMARSVWLEPAVVDGKIKTVNLTADKPRRFKRDGDNIAVLGKEMEPVPDSDDSEGEEQETLYPDSVALEATKNSKKISREHRINYPDGVGGRASYRPGHSTGARRLNRLSALNEDKTPEEAAQIAADLAAQSRKRAIERFGPDAVKKRKGGAAAPPPPPGPPPPPPPTPPPPPRPPPPPLPSPPPPPPPPPRRRPPPRARPGPGSRPGPGPATISLTNYQAAQRVLAELTSALGGPAAIEALLAGRRAAAADNAAA